MELKKFYLSALLFLSLFFTEFGYAINEVKIVTIGIRTSNPNGDFSDAIVIKMIDFWNREIIQVTLDNPDIVIFATSYHGGFVQKEWAYSCRAHFVSSFWMDHSPSEIRNPLGQVVATSTNYFDYAVATVNLDSKVVHLDYNWDKLKKLKEKYGDKVIITDPGYIGVVLVISEDADKSVNEILKEFDIEDVDQYFRRSKAAIKELKHYN